MSLDIHDESSEQDWQRVTNELLLFASISVGAVLLVIGFTVWALIA